MTDERRPILIYEPHAGSRKRTAALVETIGFEPIAVSKAGEATAALEEPGLAAVLIANTKEGVELSQYVHEFTAVVAPVAAILAQSESEPAAVCEAMHADGYLRRPLDVSTLESFFSVASRVSGLRKRLRELEGRLGDLEDRVQRSSLTSSRTGFHHFEAVKDLLVVEVRRAKRYGYPLAVLMVGLDPIAEDHQVDRENLSHEVTAGLGVAIAKSIRVIDLPIHYADDRILVFLPHTDLTGGEEVGRRIKRRIKRITYRGNGFSLQLTASVGIAGLSAGDSLTFSKMIKNAASALKAAQLKGGDKVMKRVAGR